MFIVDMTEHATATVRKYKNHPLSPEQKSQRGSTFLKNHAPAMLVCAFLVQHTIAFNVLTSIKSAGGQTTEDYRREPRGPLLGELQGTVRAGDI